VTKGVAILQGARRHTKPTGAPLTMPALYEALGAVGLPSKRLGGVERLEGVEICRRAEGGWVVSFFARAEGNAERRRAMQAQAVKALTERGYVAKADGLEVAVTKGSER
jgi:hypothetical protein